MLLTSDTPSYDIAGLNVKIPDKLSRQILDKDSGPIYSEHEQALRYILQYQET